MVRRYPFGRRKYIRACLENRPAEMGDDVRAGRAVGLPCTNVTTCAAPHGPGIWSDCTEVLGGGALPVCTEETRTRKKTIADKKNVIIPVGRPGMVVIEGVS